MGLDPPGDHYDGGANCADCVDAIFNGKTPAWIMAVISGVSKCPIAPTAFPNGIHLLQQSVGDPCVWEKAFGLFGITYTLTDVDSLFQITFSGVFNHFIDLRDDPCQVGFDNEITGCGLGDFGFGGNAFVFWGPGVGPL